MVTRPHTGVLRRVAFGLACIVAMGPTGLAWVAFERDACQASCPCDSERAEHPAAPVAEAPQDSGDEGEDSCPLDCPECACSRVVFAAVLTFAHGLIAANPSGAVIAIRVSGPHIGTSDTIFRPPRA